uniref:Reverse transcriptase domain-containing protein n=1 Tax=Anolis carolinensis TaxID=28377 RepID=A0A803TP25_ANOCA
IPTSSFRWRLNESLLRDSTEQDRYRKLLKEYFKLNKEEDTTIDMIWDASKAYIRGMLIQQGAKEKRRRKSEFLKIEGEIDIPRITEKQREILNREISEEEISRAIKRLPANKAPGPDGLTSQYYKIFQDILIIPLQKVMNSILEGKNPPQTWKNANIVVIPKDKAENTKIQNYRPISLLNTDYKIFASILATRLKEVLIERIEEDQSGFLPGRQMKENIRNILNAIEYYDKNNHKEIAFLFLDAEKAFDNINWFFMTEILREMDAGFYFSNAIKAIYSKQTNTEKKLNRLYQTKIYFFLFEGLCFIPKEKVTQYLGLQDIPRITEKQREILNREISEEEISRAIKRLPANKAPGPDGLTSQYYKIFQDILIIPLQKVMNSILEGKNPPQTWKNANIVVIPKDKAENTKIQNYRPISLLNSDYKIFASILATRLKEVLIERIEEDQSGFLPGRQMKENIRNILNAIEYYDKNNHKEIAFLFLDAEKAFDNINWFFMTEILREMDAGFYFSNAIKAIYSKQTAKIIINGQLSNTISINKGTRQGCPLSPSLFIMTLEVLLNAIRKNKDLTGLRTKNYSYKIRAFADDVVCLIEDPLKQFNKWWATIEKYGEVAGFKINRKKTKILSKNMPCTSKEILQKETGIEIVKKVKYLGIEITASNAQLYSNNYERKWREVKERMSSWRSLQLSLLGKIAAVKMKILPDLIFLFQNLPIVRKNSILIGWNKEIRKFIWGGKKPRIRFKYLKDDIRRGGMGLPDLHLYFDAAALSWVKDWATLKKRKTLALEGQDLNKGWHSYLWRGKTSKDKAFNNHYLRVALMGIWQKYKIRFYTKTPLWLSPLEAEHMRELPRERWLTYKQLLNLRNQETNLKSYEEIKKLEPSLTWLNYWQIKESYKVDKKEGFETKDTCWDRILKADTKIIKLLYQQLLMWDTEEVQVKEAMVKWAKEVGHSINLAEWEKIWKRNLKFTYSTELRENWYKIFYRWYITPERLAKFSKGKGDRKCWKCGKHNGDFMHMWWGCKRIKKYWQEIQKEMEKILQIKFDLKPEYFLLGITNFHMDLNTEKLFTYMVTAARICLAKLWKTKEIPSVEKWTVRLIDIKNMDLLTQKVSQNALTRQWTNWDKLRQYLKKDKIELL